MFHCRNCERLVDAVKKAAHVAVILYCSLCGSVLDDLPHHAEPAMPVNIISMTSGGGSGGSAAPFRPFDTTPQIIASWRRQREAHWRVAIESTMMNQRSMGV